MSKAFSFFCLLVVVASTTTSATVSKISPTLRTKLRVNILVSMRETPATALAHVSFRSAHATRSERSQAVYNSLTAHAARSQSKVLNMIKSRAMLRGNEIQVKSFWITNQIYIKDADQSLIQALAAMEDVKLINEEQTFHVLNPLSTTEQLRVLPETETEVGLLAEWGVDKIFTTEAIAALGTNGTGTVVGILDTGVRATHRDLRDNFRGGNHAWYDPYDQSPEAHDNYGHGTHCAGTAVGGGGIGVAPGASWIACKGIMDDGDATDAALIACGEFFVCPHDHLGNNHNCSLSPDIVSNSWGIFPTDRTWYDDVLRAYHAARIIPIFAAGNEFHLFGCAFVRSPADSAVDLIAVGATDSADAIAYFSGRGPGSIGNQIPHVSAPGVDVRSASSASDDLYALSSGTSMATPHVAGLVALLRSANPTVDHSRVKSILQSTADRNLPFTGEECGGVGDNVFPNYKFGYGRINALRAAQALRSVKI